MGSVQGLEALDQCFHGEPRRLGIVLCGAGQRGLQLVAECRQSLQIRGMGKPCPQTRVVILALAPGDSEVARDRVALRCSAADEALDRMQDGVRAVCVSGE